MRLSEVLNKLPSLNFNQVEGFLGGRKLAAGKSKKLDVGRVAWNFYCKECEAIRTFTSGEELFCIGVNEHLVSIDCVLHCHCGSSVQMWFLVDCDGDIHNNFPEVRILKRSEKLSHTVTINKESHGDYSELLEKAQRAQREELGAGAMVYLRKIFEQITIQIADASGITVQNPNGSRKPFKVLLTEVDGQCSIIPQEFSMNGYRLFGELSDVVHGEYDEDIALNKFDSLHRLVVGILDKVKTNHELMEAIGELGWNDEGDETDE